MNSSLNSRFMFSTVNFRYEPKNMFQEDTSQLDQQNGKLPSSQGYGALTGRKTPLGQEQNNFGAAAGYHNSDFRGSQEHLVDPGGDYEKQGLVGDFADDGGLLPRPVAMCYDSLAAMIEPKWMVARVYLGFPDNTAVPTAESSSRVANLTMLISVDFLLLHLVTVFSPSWTWYFSILALLFLAIG